MKNIIFGFLLLLGVFFLVFSVNRYTKVRSLLQTGTTTKALVIDEGEESGMDGYEYTPIFEYKDNENNTITFVSSTTSTNFKYSVGDSVDIIYFEDEPNSEKINSFFDLYGLAFVFGVLGIVFSVIGLGFLIHSFRNK
ncbi:DUF3592 domain-containing protein [Bernardetia sp. ABR2-2B]|uniref:DUF3592 domain-containing protein n=1 Tax=Bernardetia sp. ABR2-2B TaxID=3127472 RepID=UPI0030D3917B